jgi:hypothetical protein
MTTRPKPNSRPYSRPSSQHVDELQYEEPQALQRNSRPYSRPNSTHGHESQHEEKAKRERNPLKNHLIAASGEFVGTFMFLYFGFSTHLMVVDQTSDVARSNGKNSAQTVVFISLGYGISLLVTAWGWYRISGGLFNPAVCLSSSQAFFLVSPVNSNF